MPLYEYQCLPNSHRFEVRHPITQDPVKECPVCGGGVRRVIHPVGIVFKGSGFYATDSRGKGVNSTVKPNAEGTSDGKQSEGASSDSATAAKSADSAAKSTESSAKTDSKASSTSEKPSKPTQKTS